MQPLVPNDLYELALLVDPQRDPARARTFYRRTSFDRTANVARGTIWCVTDTGAARAFTSGTNDRSARPSPDGAHLAFVADGAEEGTAQLKLLPLDGGEARLLGKPMRKLGALAWSRDGKRLAFTAAAPFDASSARIMVDEKTKARHIRALPFKSDDDGLLDGVRKHLFVVDLADGAPRQVTFGDFDVLAPDWSAEGGSVVFAAAIDVSEFRFTRDIHVVDVASGERRALTQGEGALGLPRVSRDGATVAFVGNTHGDDAGGRFNDEVLVVPFSGGAIRSLSASLDRTVGDSLAGDLRDGMGTCAPWWSPGGEVVVQICDEGTVGVRAFAHDGTSRILAAGERDIYAFSCGDDGTMTIAYATPTAPSALAVVASAGTETRVSTDNDALLAERTIATPRRIRPKAADGTVLDAWILEPAASHDGPRPLVLQVHGGPHAAYGYAFSHEFQTLVSRGFVVAYGNPRGGQSYGHAYADAITGDWGGIDADDMLAILDGVESAVDVDRSRIGLAGGSYGGFMTTWLLGHSDRFAAGVSMRAVNDFVSEIGASDLGWFLEREVDAYYANDAGQALFDNSPMRAAKNITAPLLIDHSERDYRCPIDQGEQLFTILRRMGKNAEFVRFTGDGHNLSRTGSPRNRILRLRAITHWFDRYLIATTPRPHDAGSLFAPIPHETDEISEGDAA
jgi:dipeptidyl aminopeptidase/acylaminoacyl peptidase